MALSKSSLPVHSNYTDPLKNYMIVKDETSAKLDYDCEDNTNRIIQFNTAYGTNTSSYAAPYCKAYTFVYPTGQRGCLISAGQLLVVYQNKAAINACLTACGGTTISEDWIRSSTYVGIYNNGECTWDINMISGAFGPDWIISSHDIRPVSAYEL